MKLQDGVTEQDNKISVFKPVCFVFLVFQIFILLFVLAGVRYYFIDGYVYKPEFVLYGVVLTIVNCLLVQYLGMRGKKKFVTIRVYCFAAFSVLAVYGIVRDSLTFSSLLGFILLIIGMASFWKKDE